MRQISPSAALPAPAPHQVLDRRATGTPAELAAAVATLRDSGRLVAVSPPQPMPGDDRRVFAYVRYLAPSTPATVAVARRRRWPSVVAITGTAAAALAAAGWAVIQLVHAAAAAAPTIAGFLLVVAVIAWLLLGRAGVCCPGLHCPGCRH